MVLHRLDRGQHRASVGAVALREAGPLRPPRGPYVGVHEPVADLPGEIRTVMLGDQGMHHVQRGGSAGARHAVPVHDVKGAFEQEAGVPLGEGGVVLPVQRHPPVRHDAGIGEDRRPTRHAAQHASAPRLLPQPLEHPNVAKGDRVAARDDEGEVKCTGRVLEVADRDRGRGRAAQPSPDRRAGSKIEKLVDPAARQQVGGAKGFGDGRERHEGKPFDQNESDSTLDERNSEHVLDDKDSVCFPKARTQRPAHQSVDPERTRCVIPSCKS